MLGSGVTALPFNFFPYFLHLSRQQVVSYKEQPQPGEGRRLHEYLRIIGSCARQHEQKGV